MLKKKLMYKGRSMQDFNKLYEKTLLHNYHEAFFKLFRIPLDWISPDNRTFTLCGSSHCNGLCAKIMADPDGAEKCRILAVKRIAEAKSTGKPVINRCHAGFLDVIIPIIVDGEYQGGLSIGQFNDHQVDDDEIEKIRKQLDFINFAPNELENFIRNTHIFTSTEMEGLIELMGTLGEYICQSHARLQFMESISRTDPIRAAEEYIQRYFVKKLSVDVIARSVGMSKSHFIHKFTEQTGSSPIAYLNNYRIVQAQEMLKNKTLSIPEIAIACGFSSISHFNRQFRKYTGMSPGENRRNS